MVGPPLFSDAAVSAFYHLAPIVLIALTIRAAYRAQRRASQAAKDRAMDKKTRAHFDQLIIDSEVDKWRRSRRLGGI